MHEEQRVVGIKCPRITSTSAFNYLDSDNISAYTDSSSVKTSPSSFLARITTSFIIAPSNLIKSAIATSDKSQEAA